MIKKLILLLASCFAAVLTASVNADVTVIPVEPNPATGTSAPYPFVKGKLYQMGVVLKNGGKKTYPGHFVGWGMANGARGGATGKVVIKAGPKGGHVNAFSGEIYAIFEGEHTMLFYKSPGDWFIAPR
jgi:hypothetical protein